MSDIKVYVNHVGQTLLAEEVGTKDNTISLKNPAILHVVPNQTGQLQVQLIPYFFREFLDQSVRNNGITFSFDKTTLVSSDAVLEEKIKDQYTRLFASVPAKPSKDPQVIKLFDD